MNYLKFISVLIGISFVLLSCEVSDKDVIQTESSANTISSHAPRFDPTIYSEDDKIILGEKRENPYEISNMLYAYGLLQDIRQNFIIGDTMPYVNMIYYRVLPRDSNDIAILSADTSVMYFDYPLEFDIIQWGNYYHDPTVEDSIFTWMYAVVPVEHTLPNLPTVEILQRCYLPNEPIGNDGHYEEIPDWQNGYAMLEYVAYRESGNIDMYDSTDVAIYEEILRETAYRGANNSDNAPREGNRSLIWDFICGVHPEGVFRVEDTYTNRTEGIRNVNVFIHNFIKLYCGPVNENGYYYSAKRFRTNCWYHIRFYNHHTDTRIYGGLKFLIGPVHRHLGWHSRYGYDYALNFDDVAWRYATINNAVEIYHRFCQAFNIIFPYGMRIWTCGINNAQWAGSTPLFHKRGVPVQEMIFRIAAQFLGPLAGIVFFFDVPDMALFIGEGDPSYDTPRIYSTVFHELGHASHYEKVGNLYWSLYVLHIIIYQGYGNHADGLYHGYCGIGEMWGNFVAAHVLYRYLGYTYPYVYITAYGNLNYVAYSPPLPSGCWFNPTEDWYNPGILAMIHEDSNCSITNIYDALNPDVYSLGSLKNSLQNQGILESKILNAYSIYNEWNQ